MDIPVLSRSSSAYSIGTPKGKPLVVGSGDIIFSGRFWLLNFGGGVTPLGRFGPQFIVSHLERYFFLERGGNVQVVRGMCKKVSELKSLQRSWTLKCPKKYEALKNPSNPSPFFEEISSELKWKKNMCEDWSFVDPLQLHQIPLEVKSAIKLIVHNFWDPKNPLTLQWKGDRT